MTAHGNKSRDTQWKTRITWRIRRDKRRKRKKEEQEEKEDEHRRE